MGIRHAASSLAAGTRDGISRRQFGILGGAAGLEASGVIPATARGRVVLGANRKDFPALHKRVPLARAVRVYYDGENNIPPDWPEGLPGTWVTVSICPHPRDLLAGRLDSALRSLVRSAPPRSELTAWYEAGPANARHYPSYITPTAVREVQRYLWNMTRRTHVRVGQIICGPAMQMAEYLDPHADWWGVDWYFNERYLGRHGFIVPSRMRQRMVNNRAVYQRLSGQRYPRLRICETNAGHDRFRNTWFGWQAALMSEFGGGRLITFWREPGRSRHGPLSGPWPPSDAVADGLHKLSEAYRRPQGR